MREIRWKKAVACFMVLIALSLDFTAFPDYRGGVKRVSAATEFVVDASGTLTAYNGNDTIVTVPASVDSKTVTAIGAGVFSAQQVGSGIISVSLPAGVTSIGNQAFKGQTNLRSITIPENVTTIGTEAFSGCTNLFEVSYQGTSKCETIGIRAFENCSSLSDTTLPNSVKVIKDYAFSGCSKLGFSTLSTALAQIGAYAFQNCTTINTITIANTVTSLGEGVFYGCTKLQSVTLPSNITAVPSKAFMNCSSLQYIVIPEKVASIGEKAFNGAKISKIYFPKTLLSIGVDAFPLVDRSRVTKVYYGGTSYTKIADGGNNYQIYPNSENKVENNTSYTRYAYKFWSSDMNLYWYWGKSASALTGIVEEEQEAQHVAEEAKKGGLYYDIQHTKDASGDTIELYANGAKVTDKDGTTRDLKTFTLYTDIGASYLHKSGVAGTGKVFAIVSTSSSKPAHYGNKVTDISAKNIAKATISNGVIKISAFKDPGRVYLHVIDTGDNEVYATCTIDVYAAPTTMEIRDTEGNLFKKATVNSGDSIRLDIKSYYKSGSGANVELSYDDCEIVGTADPKTTGCVDIAISTNSGYSEIQALGLVNGKKTTSTITFSNPYNKKTTKFKLTIENAAEGVGFTGVKAASNIDFKQDVVTRAAVSVATGSAVVREIPQNSFTLTVPADKLKEDGTLNEKITVQILTAVEPIDNWSQLTEKGKIFAMGLESGYDEGAFESGKMKVSVKPDKDQKMIKVKTAKDNKSLTVTFAKGTPMDCTAYYMYYFNSDSGYVIFSIKTVKAPDPEPEPEPTPDPDPTPDPNPTP